MYCLAKFQGRGPREGNCQDFVEDVLTCLGFSLPNFQGALASFLQEMRTKGSSELIFRPAPELAKKLNMPEPSITFTNHKQLDDFVNGIKMQKEFALWSHDYPGEYALLKSFDRAFWVRNFKDPTNEMFQPHKCPFDDPRTTKSMLNQ